MQSGCIQKHDHCSYPGSDLSDDDNLQKAVSRKAMQARLWHCDGVHQCGQQHYCHMISYNIGHVHVDVSSAMDPLAWVINPS